MDQMGKKSQASKSNDFINKLYEDNSKYFYTEGRKPIKIAIFSDLHVDYDYTPGFDNKCGKPLCCRKDSGKAPTPERAAGLWGDFECDSSPRLVESLLDHIKKNVKPDAVFWSGDSVSHILASNSIEETIDTMNKVSSQVS